MNDKPNVIEFQATYSANKERWRLDWAKSEIPDLLTYFRESEDLHTLIECDLEIENPTDGQVVHEFILYQEDNYLTYEDGFDYDHCWVRCNPDGSEKEAA